MRVHAVAGVVAPVAPLSTTFTSVSVGATAVLVIVQVTSSPRAMVIVPSGTVAPSHDQSEAV